MKALGIVGSPRKGGNTEYLAKHVLQAIDEEGLDTELVHLVGLDIRPCNACLVCKKEERCPIDDDLYPIYTKMKEAEAMILASPVYFGSATALMRAFMERTGYIARPGRRFKGKVGGPLVVARRGGHVFTHAEMLLWFHINEIIVPGSTYWNIAFGWDKGEVESDKLGLDTAWDFGKNVAELVKKLKS